MGGTRYDGDFSTDMVDQFAFHAGVTLPKDIASIMGDDSEESKCLRGDWLWREHREAWLNFYDWRWERFFEKVCTRVHAAGKKVIVLGMYCTDPFESMYLMGFNVKSVIRAGVDYIMPNIVATGLYMESKLRSFFHRYMNIIPLIAAQVPEGKYLCMLGVQDASEEWDVLHHAPCKLERDVYTMLSYRLTGPAGSRRCMDGLLICLGDGIPRNDWAWLKERMDVAFSADVDKPVSPTMVWSDTAHERMLPAYIKTRRWSAHKFLYELSERGACCGAVVRSENVNLCENALFAPNVDLCDDGEIRRLASYTGGTVICTAAPDFDPEAHGFKPDICFSDRFANYPMRAFALNAEISPETKEEIDVLLAYDDNVPDVDPANTWEHVRLVQDDIPFRNVSSGFVEACAVLVKAAGKSLFDCTLPHTAFRLKDGRYRLYLYGSSEDRYSHALVATKRPIDTVTTVSKFPVLPARFVEKANKSLAFAYENGDRARCCFQIKLAPGSVTIVDVSLIDA
jgi:hypothetical protein